MLTLLCVHNVIYILIVELKATLKKTKIFKLQKYSPVDTC